MTTFSLKFCKRLYALVGEHGRESTWLEVGRYAKKEWILRGPDFCWACDATSNCSHAIRSAVPACSFSELIRLLPAIAAKKHTGTYGFTNMLKEACEKLAWAYMDAPTEKEGIERCEAYLDSEELI